MKKGDITYLEKLNELRLDLTHPNSRGINFIFVEGDSDIRLFRKFFDLTKCKVESIPGGNPKLEECVTQLVRIYPLIIGIRDADFIHLNEAEYDIPNMFLTDFHDIETTMLSDDNILNSLVFEYSDLPKNQHINFRANMMKAIQYVGYFKWLNSIENLELTFSKCGFQDLISFVNLEIDQSEYIKRVIGKSENAKIKDEQIIDTKINALFVKNPNLSQLTNGHDLIITFAKYFREVKKHKGLSDQSIASSLRMQFAFDSFRETELFKEIESWSNTKSTSLFA